MQPQSGRNAAADSRRQATASRPAAADRQPLGAFGRQEAAAWQAVQRNRKARYRHKVLCFSSRLPFIIVRFEPNVRRL